MTNKENNVIVEDTTVFQNIFQNFPQKLKSFSKQTLTNLFL